MLKIALRAGRLYGILWSAFGGDSDGRQILTSFKSNGKCTPDFTAFALLLIKPMLFSFFFINNHQQSIIRYKNNGFGTFFMNFLVFFKSDPGDPSTTSKWFKKKKSCFSLQPQPLCLKKVLRMLEVLKTKKTFDTSSILTTFFRQNGCGRCGKHHFWRRKW